METDDRVDICVYLCYILDRFGELAESTLEEIILLSAPSEYYFEVMGNISFMLSKNLIEKKNDRQSNSAVYSLLHDGRKLAADLGSSLPRGLRERTDSEGNAVLKRNDRERSLRCEIIPYPEKNRYDVNVRFINEMNGDTILDLTLYAPDKEKAEEMRERFLSKPAFILTRIMNMFLKDDYFVYDQTGEK